MSELEGFVLGYLEEVGGLIEPAGSGVKEVLLPEAQARAWEMPAYLKITFAEEDAAGTVRLGYNHPLVEQMVQEARRRPASTRLFINDLRLDKRALDELAGQTWTLPNARVQPEPRATVGRVRSTYILFHCKVALYSHEKREHLVSVLMDADAGHPVVEMEPIVMRAVAGSPDDLLYSLPDAPVRWSPGNGAPLAGPLELRALQGLWQRLGTAVFQVMGDELKNLERRMARFRELDEARLTDYYNGLEHDLRQRLAGASEGRQGSLQDKLAAVKSERASKLADLADRYRVRLELSLINLTVIQQPKLIMPVRIENRSTRLGAYAVWDPLRHCLEPLVCRVCGLPGQRLFLCHNGHLAHEDCLAPACIDCKRVFCQECAGEVGECAVCHQPLCRHSRITCSECGRGTCRAHAGLCHAQAGQPAVLESQPEAPPPPEPEPVPVKVEAKVPARGKVRARPKRKTKPARKQSNLPAGLPRPQSMDVISYPDSVVAFVLASRDRQVAVRAWTLSLEAGGILARCDCYKGLLCPEHNLVYRPPEEQSLEQFIMERLEQFRVEFRVPARKMVFNRSASPNSLPYRVPRLVLTGRWKDASFLRELRQAYDRKGREKRGRR